MILCPNLKNPEVARVFDELKQATSEQAAYHIWSLNNGNAIDKAPNGAESKLFQTLLEHYNGDRTKAIQAKAKVYGNSFLTWFGDWINDTENASKVVDKNGEPLMVWHGGYLTENNSMPNPTYEEETYDWNGYLIPGRERNPGIWFSTDKEYTTNFSSKQHPCFLNIRNPYRGDDLSSRVAADIRELEDYTISEEDLQAQGGKSDGLIGHDVKTWGGLTIEELKNDPRFGGPIPKLSKGIEFAIYDPNQAKSIDNEGPTQWEGTYSRENDDIYLSIDNANARSNSDISITNQLISHLRSIGIKVRNRRDMIKYLREHDLVGLQKFIGRKARTGYGVTIQTEALNITGNKFKNSLYRGQGYTPIIDAEGNLHLHTNYDSLSKLRTLSFDSTIEGAEHYGNRSAMHPYIIEVDEDFLDTVVPKEDYDKYKVDRGESFRYDEEFNEVRLSFKDELIIPKGRFNITQTNETLQFESFNDIIDSIRWLQSLEERLEVEEYNGASEIIGRVHMNDINALYNALHNTLGAYEGYDVSTILYDVLALQNYTAGSPIGPSRQYKEFINKGLIETEYQNGYTYYMPSKDIVKYLTKKLGLKEVSVTSQPILYQNPHTPYSPYISSDEFDLPFFLTPSGEVYGFVAPNDDIYLDETVISPEHPIHEYTHMWDRTVAEKNSNLWKKGVELMKQIPLWEQIENNPNYGQRWRVMSDMTADRFEFLVASEVHSRLVGEDGSKLLDRIAKQNGKKGIVTKLKQWILDFWKDLKSTFSDWSESDIQKLTLDDFNHMTVRDFADGVNFNNTSSNEFKSQLQKLGAELMERCKG